MKIKITIITLVSLFFISPIQAADCKVKVSCVGGGRDTATIEGTCESVSSGTTLIQDFSEATCNGEPARKIKLKNLSIAAPTAGGGKTHGFYGDPAMLIQSTPGYPASYEMMFFIDTSSGNITDLSLMTTQPYTENFGVLGEVTRNLGYQLEFDADLPNDCTLDVVAVTGTVIISCPNTPAISRSVNTVAVLNQCCDFFLPNPNDALAWDGFTFSYNYVGSIGEANFSITQASIDTYRVQSANGVPVNIHTTYSYTSFVDTEFTEFELLPQNVSVLPIYGYLALFSALTAVALTYRKQKKL